MLLLFNLDRPRFLVHRTWQRGIGFLGLRSLQACKLPFQDVCSHHAAMSEISLRVVGMPAQLESVWVLQLLPRGTLGQQPA